eukprot:m.361175 g.361175  ORF g.361175 m.361175 type:complete len:485 (-) comp19397_c0_seq1:552-2006(-)
MALARVAFGKVRAQSVRSMASATTVRLAQRALSTSAPRLSTGEDKTMSSEEMVQLCKDHTMYTWSAQAAVNPIPISHCDGVYMYRPDGTRLLDMNSQLMCSNIGHNNQRVIKAIQDQAAELAYVSPMTATRIRAKVGKKLADLMPGDIDKFLFCLSGAEANENAIKLARQYTGKSKILTRHRAFHGATNATMTLTGDPRRWSNEPGMPGVVRVMDPYPYNYSFGTTEEEIAQNNLRYVEEVIMYEGPGTIAAMLVETVTGTNGVLAPPKGYLEGLRELTEKNGILLICDEVMAGFGRTGKFMAFEHANIVPDLVTMAKGLTSAYLPLGAVGMRKDIADYFDNNVFWGGLTYNSHPVCLAAADAAIDVLMEDKLIERTQQMELVMRSELDALKAKHPSVKEGRCIGLFGMVDVQRNSKGDLIAPYNGSHPAMLEMVKELSKSIYTFARWSHFTLCPPLIISEDELREGFGVIDRALDITDAAFEG